MTGYKAYCLYLALKNHFRSESYDFIKYHGRVTATPSSFDARKDKYFFEKLARKYTENELIEFFVANILRGRKYIIDMMKQNEDEAEEAHIDFKRRKESFTYYFEEDLDKTLKYVTSAKSLFRMRKNGYPEIITQYLNGNIHIQSLVVLDDFITFSKVFDIKLGKDEYLWSDIRMKISKTRAFTKYDRSKIENVIRTKMLNNG